MLELENVLRKKLEVCYLFGLGVGIKRGFEVLSCFSIKFGVAGIYFGKFISNFIGIRENVGIFRGGEFEIIL